MEAGTSNDTVQERMQLNCLIKKNNEASSVVFGQGNSVEALPNYTAGKVLLYFTKFWKTTSLSLCGLFFCVLHTTLICFFLTLRRGA